MEEGNKNQTGNSVAGWISFALATLCMLPFATLFVLMFLSRFPKTHMLWEYTIGMLLFVWPVMLLPGVVGLIAILVAWLLLQK